MSVPDFAALSTDAAQALLLSTSRSVGVGMELLDSVTLVATTDVSSALQPGSGSVKWNAATTACEWGCSATLTVPDELPPTQLVRLYKTITDRDSGLVARGNMGAFFLSWPERAAGRWVRGDDGSRLLPFAVTGADRTSILDWPPGYSYVQLAKDGSSNPVMVLDAIRAVFTAAGIPLTSVLIDGARATAPMPGDKVWPIVSTDSSTTAGATWRQILTDLLALVAYQPPFMDGNGFIRCSPEFDPSVAQPSAKFAVDMGWVSPLAQARTRSRDLASVPNRETFIWEDMVDGSGNSITPTPANGGVLVLSNPDSGPTSITALGGVPTGIRSRIVSLSAASLDDFTAQANAQARKDQRVLTQYKVSTVPWPLAGHRDVFTYIDPDVTGVTDGVQVQASAWESPLSNADTSWTWDDTTAVDWTSGDAS